jgi:PEP-CTERM motif
MKSSRTINALAAAGFLSLTALSHAQLALNTTGTYTQDFNTLPTSGTIAWANNTTLAGWFAQRETGVLNLVASTGSLTGAALYDFGSTASTDRALGSIGSGTTGDVAWGVIFSNTSADTLTFGNFDYTGELWRRGATGKVDTLEFDYQIGAVAVTNLMTAGGWTAVNALDFTNPNTAGGAGALDGNNAANRTTLSTVLNLALAPGQFITFRWLDIDHPGTDNGLAIDNVSIAYSAAAAPPLAAVPEPSTYGLLAAGVLAGIVMKRQRHRRAT